MKNHIKIGLKKGCVAGGIALLTYIVENLKNIK